MTVKIIFINNEGYKLCERLSTINACNEVPSGCDPDNVGQWIIFNHPEDVDFYCTDNASGLLKLCHVTFNFEYRNIVVNGIQHRDVQILDYTKSGSCDCFDEQMYQMIEKMWSETDVKNEFNLDDPTWQVTDPPSIKCKDDFRVISADCWYYFSLPFGNNQFKIFTKECESDACCWSSYYVCYRKTGANQFELVTDPPPGMIISSIDPPPACPSGCSSRNCNYITFTNSAHLDQHPNESMKKADDISGKYSPQPCKVYLVNNEENDKLSAKLECGQNGNVGIMIFDLLGNAVYKTEINKNSFSITVPINVNLSSGIYLLRVNMDDVMIFNDKINIVR